NTVFRTTNDARSFQRFDVHNFFRIKLTSIDRDLDTTKRYNVKVFCENVGETTLRQTAVDWHLSAFKTVNRYACTRRLSLDATAIGLTGTRTNTATNAFWCLDRTRLVTQIVEFHFSVSLRSQPSSTTRTRC